ncbi:hypothetical protein GLYMA_04G062150v4 [Glycine max]|nr:hypothetical protein GLYMA_04G062150v4 [Glycine max]KAH1110054.1 hypothetical protein GYH30_009109 [Glycine max]
MNKRNTMLKEWFLHMQIVDKLRWYLQKGDMVWVFSFIYSAEVNGGSRRSTLETQLHKIRRCREAFVGRTNLKDGRIISEDFKIRRCRKQLPCFCSTHFFLSNGESSSF